MPRSSHQALLLLQHSACAQSLAGLAAAIPRPLHSLESGLVHGGRPASSLAAGSPSANGSVPAVTARVSSHTCQAFVIRRTSNMHGLSGGKHLIFMDVATFPVRDFKHSVNASSLRQV